MYHLLYIFFPYMYAWYLSVYGLDDYIIVEQVPSGISVSNLPAYQLLCL
jgi:hypothetical protein